MEEIFKDIKGYEGLYQVSNLGRVKSLCYGKELILKPIVDKDGYLKITLHKNTKMKTYRVHRLVAEAFIPNPYGLPQVNHIDECKTNNIVTNLEYCDCNYNNNHGTANKRRAEKHTNHPNLSKRVYQYSKDGLMLWSYPSLHEAERQTGIAIQRISACCLNKSKRKSAGGYIWSYDPPKSTIPRVLF